MNRKQSIWKLLWRRKIKLCTFAPLMIVGKGRKSLLLNLIKKLMGIAANN